MLLWHQRQAWVALLISLFFFSSSPLKAQDWPRGETTYIGIALPEGDVPTQQANPVFITVKGSRIVTVLQGEQAIGLFRRTDVAPLARWPLAGKTLGLLESGIGWLAVQENKPFLTVLHPRSGIIEAQLPLSSPIDQIAYSAGARSAGLLSLKADRIDMIDLQKGTVEKSLAGFSGLRAFALSPGGNRLAAVEGQKNDAILIEAATGTPYGRFTACEVDIQKPAASSVLLAFLDEHKVISYCDQSDALRMYDHLSNQTKPLTQEDLPQKYAGLFPIPNSSFIILLPATGDKLDVFSIKEKRIIHSIAAGVGPHACALKELTLLCVAKQEGLLLRQQLPFQLSENRQAKDS